MVDKNVNPSILELARRIVAANPELLQRLSRGAVGGNPAEDGHPTNPERAEKDE